MSLLAAAFTPREVEFPVYRGLDGETGSTLALSWRTTTVAPPTTADALAVLHLAALPEREGHRAGLLAVARRWLRPRDAADLTAFSDRGLARALLSLLSGSSGITPDLKAEAEAAAVEVAGSRGPEGVDDAVLTVALSLGVSPGDVLVLPWPAFLASARALPRVQAAAELRTATAARAAQADRAGWTTYTKTLRGLASGTDEPTLLSGGPARYGDNAAVWSGRG